MFDLTRQVRLAISKRSHSHTLAVCGLATLAISNIALAQQPAGESQVVGPETLDEIMVTARRREETLQDTPVAVTALSAAALERQQIVSTTTDHSHQIAGIASQRLLSHTQPGGILPGPRRPETKP